MKLRILKDTRWDFGSSILTLKVGGIREVESHKHCADLIKYGFAEEVKTVEPVQIKAVQSVSIENKAVMSSQVETKTVEPEIKQVEPAGEEVGDEPQPVVRRGRKAKK